MANPGRPLTKRANQNLGGIGRRNLKHKIVPPAGGLVNHCPEVQGRGKSPLPNRHERRRARKMAQNKFYDGYIRHLPSVPLEAPLERGRVYHMVVFHDDWCAFYGGGGCNCDPIITKHVEPRRS